MEHVIDPHWKHVEKIAASLEQSLSPMAKVRHNVILPVLGIPGDTRQCDVVITYEIPRPFIAIVEVQDRRRKPTINEFEGWVEKMREVGANALICVSECGYPDSIKNRVLRKYGPIVTLLTLSELKEPQILKSMIIPQSTIRYHSYRIHSVGMVELEGKQFQSGEDVPQPLQFNYIDKIFQYGDSPERRSLQDFVSLIFNQNLRNPQLTDMPTGKTIECNINIHLDNESILWVYCAEKRFKVLTLPVSVILEISETKIPVKCYSYRQEMIDNVQAWVADANGIVKGENVEFRLIFLPGKDGILRQLLFQPVKPERGATFCIDITDPDQASATAAPKKSD